MEDDEVSNISSCQLETRQIDNNRLRLERLRENSGSRKMSVLIRFSNRIDRQRKILIRKECFPVDELFLFLVNSDWIHLTVLIIGLRSSVWFLQKPSIVKEENALVNARLDLILSSIKEVSFHDNPLGSSLVWISILTRRKEQHDANSERLSCTIASSYWWTFFSISFLISPSVSLARWRKRRVQREIEGIRFYFWWWMLVSVIDETFLACWLSK